MYIMDNKHKNTFIYRQGPYIQSLYISGLYAKRRYIGLLIYRAFIYINAISYDVIVFAGFGKSSIRGKEGAEREREVTGTGGRGGWVER